MSAMPLLQLPKITRCVKEVIAIKQRKPSLKSEEGLYLSAMPFTILFWEYPTIFLLVNEPHFTSLMKFEQFKPNIGLV